MKLSDTVKTRLLNLSCIVFLAFTFEVVMGCGVDDGGSQDPPAADAATPPVCEDTECPDGQACVDNTCRPEHCADGMVSGDETMADCGGSCAACVASDAGVSMDLGTTRDAGADLDAQTGVDGGVTPDAAANSDMMAGRRRCEGRTVASAEELATLEGCEVIDGDLIIAETEIADLAPLAALSEVTGALIFRSNPQLGSLAPLTNLTAAFTLTIEGNTALANLAGLVSLATINDSLTIAGNVGLRDLSALNGLSGLGGTISIHDNPVLCQVMVLHFVEQQLRRNPGTSAGNTGDNGIEEPSCGPLCPEQCLDGDQCFGDFYSEETFCVEGCRGVIDCSQISFCREIDGCVPAPGCQPGQPCAEECAKSCVYPGPCMADADCPEGSYCEIGFDDGMPRYCRASCQSSDDCANEGTVCVAERCVDGCLEDADCGADGRCVGAAADEGVAGACEFEFPPSTCEAPRVIGDGSYGGDTSMAAASVAGTCGGLLSGESVFAYQPEAPGLICADTIGSLFDTLLHVRTGSCDSEGCTQLGCNDDDPGVQSRVRFNADPQAVYFIIVDGFNQGGIFTLNVGPCAEDNMGMGAEDPVACP